MQNIIVTGAITSMSNKNDSKFKQEIPTKTAYIIVDESDAKRLEEFGLTQYTSESGDKFFIVKVVRELRCYVSNEIDSEPTILDMTTETGIGIKTVEGKTMQMNIISSENMGNKFYRLQAIKVDDTSDIEEIKATNPFA